MKATATDAGAIFNDAHYKLQKAHARILWKVTLDTIPPATNRTLKPEWRYDQNRWSSKL